MSSSALFLRTSAQGRVPSAVQLPIGKIAINTYDGTLFMSKDTGSGPTVFDLGLSTLARLTSAMVVGALAFTPANPNAPMTVAGRVAATDHSSSGASTVATQGAYLQWNRDAGNGGTWIGNQKGAGIGGINFGEVSTSNVFTTTAFLSAVGDFTPTGAIILNGASGARIKVASAGTDAKNWDVIAAATTLTYRLVNDAYSAANNWLTVTRSGYTVTSVTFGGVVTAPSASFTGSVGAASASVSGLVSAGSLNVTGNVTFNSAFSVQGSNGVRVVVASAGADAKYSDIIADASSIYFRFVNDAYTAATTWLKVVRSGYGISAINFNGTINAPSVAITGSITAASLSTTGSITSGSSLFLNSSSGFTMTLASAPTDQKMWDSYADSSNLYFRAVNDAYSVGNAWLTVTRSATAITNLAFNGPLSTIGQVSSTAAGTKFRLNDGTFGTLLYSDSSYFYVLLTNSGSPNGSFNSLRPFYVNLASGAVTMANSVIIAGGVSADSIKYTAGSNYSSFIPDIYGNLSIYSSNVAGGARLYPNLPVSIIDPSTSDLSSLVVSSTANANGVNVKLIGNGTATPSKTIRVYGGVFQIINDAYGAALFTMDDLGNISVAGAVSSGTNRYVLVTAYGADPSGTNDSTTAIQNAINAASAMGRDVLIPPGVYLISSSISIGNGTANSASTIPGCKLIGVGQPNQPAAAGVGYPASAFTQSTSIRWIGSAGQTMFYVMGPVTGWGFQNLHICGLRNPTLYGNGGAAFGIYVLSGRYGDSRNLTVEGCTSAITETTRVGSNSGFNGIDCNSYRNRWQTVNIAVPWVNGAMAILLTGAYDSSVGAAAANTCYDDWQNIDINLPTAPNTASGGVYSASSSSYGVYLQAADTCMIRHLHFFNGGQTAYPLVYDYNLNSSWPDSCVIEHVDYGGYSIVAGPIQIAGTPANNSNTNRVTAAEANFSAVPFNVPNISQPSSVIFRRTEVGLTAPNYQINGYTTTPGSLMFTSQNDNAMYRLNYYLLVSGTSSNIGTLTLYVSWHDPLSNPCSASPQLSVATSGVSVSGSIVMYCSKGSQVLASLSISGVTPNSTIQYAYAITVEKIS